jgi:oligopeptide transport system substrate-binding protein
VKLSSPAWCLVALLLVAAVWVLPGCGGQAAANANEDAGLVVLRRTEAEDPRTMDPHASGDVISSRHCGMTYECLYQYDYLADPPELVPALASEMYHYDPETKTYTFPLRRDVYFQADRCFHPDAQGRSYSEEGERMQSERGPPRHFNAHDMVYSFKRFAAQTETGGYWVFEDAGIVGLEDFRNRALELYNEGPLDDPGQPLREYIRNTDVEGIRAVDDYTFQVQLGKVYPQFVHAITLSYGAAVPWEADEYYRDNFFRKPVGTGPFRLAEWRPNWRVVWERNPDFRDEYFPHSDKPEDERYRHLMGKPLPLADRVIFTIMRESQTRWLNFRNGLLDFSGLDRDQFESAVAQGDLTPELAERGIQMERHAEPTLSYIAFNMNDPVVGTPAGERGRALRAALARAIDREDYITRYLNGRGQVATQVTPPNMIGHFPDYHAEAQTYDPDAAIEILREAGFIIEGSGSNRVARDPDTGRQATVTVSLRRTDDAMRDYARFLQSSGARVGIRVNSEMMTFAEWLRRRAENDGQIFDSGWIMDYPDAQNMLQLLYGPNRPPGVNGAAYASPEYDALYAAMVGLNESNPEQLEQKLELIREMNAVLERDVPWILMLYREDVVLFHDWYVPPKPNYFAYTFIKFEYADSERRSAAAVEWTKAPWWPATAFAILMMVPVGLVTAKLAKQR